MKQKKLKLSTVILLPMIIGIAFIGTGCQKDEIEYADESMVFTIGSAEPGIAIYKTKGDYFNYISFLLLDDGRLNATPDFTLKSLENPLGKSTLKRDKNGKIVPNFRWHLRNGYIICRGVSLTNTVFADITFQEFVDYTEKHNTACWPHELLKPRIIDKDPFKEYYYLYRYGRSSITLTVGEINKMIEEGTLETVFEKLK